MLKAMAILLFKVELVFRIATCFLLVLVLAPPAAVGVTSGVYKRKPPTLQSWKQVFSPQRKQGGMRPRPASHEISHSNTSSKIPSELCIQHVALMAVSFWH